MMRPPKPEYHPVEGKTFSLFGRTESTEGYYSTIRELADKIVLIHPGLEELIANIQRFSVRKKTLKNALGKDTEGRPMYEILNLIDPILSKYTEKVEEHLKNLPLTKLWDRRLATSREQYHLYMLEIELTNRLFREEFLKADRKVALLPYCLQDFSVDCKAEKTGPDYQCRHCSGKCYQNHTSLLLKSNNIEPYIWMGGDLKQLAKFPLSQNKTFGVLGIACVPELTFGMRGCRKNRIPVVGLPLNANRCRRWFSECLPNSIDLAELERLVSE